MCFQVFLQKEKCMEVKICRCRSVCCLVISSLHNKLKKLWQVPESRGLEPRLHHHVQALRHHHDHAATVTFSASEWIALCRHVKEIWLLSSSSLLRSTPPPHPDPWTHPLPPPQHSRAAFLRFEKHKHCIRTQLGKLFIVFLFFRPVNKR